ncbi:hypothetical protein ACFLXQ_01500 [Chloroflexota bacterium]
MTLPRHISALVDPDVLDDPEISDAYIEETYYMTDVYPDSDEDWLQELLRQHPGAWASLVCRIKHDVPETNQGIAFCGLCQEYANPRKRARSEALGQSLPGLDGAFKIHPRCSQKALTWLRHKLYQWEKAGHLERRPMSKIPDIRQARGWDYATRLYWR